MSNWKNVLIYADGRPESAMALSQGLQLAERTTGRATALDVLHYLPARIPSGLLAMEEAELLGLMLEQRREQLIEDVERLRLSAKVEVRVTQGNPAFELIRQAVRGKHDLIVKTARGRDVRHPSSFGSTALHLVRKSPVPVLLVSPQRALLERPKVLCALELETRDGQDGLNRRLLKSASHLAAAQSAELHVVHVIDERRTAAYRNLLSGESFERFAQERHRAFQEDLERLLKRELAGESTVHAQLLEGEPADRLVGMVQQQRFSHLVMGSVAENGPGMLVGSLAEEVLSRVECSVLMLKPEGFKTPIAVDIAPAA